MQVSQRGVWSGPFSCQPGGPGPAPHGLWLPRAWCSPSPLPHSSPAPPEAAGHPYPATSPLPPAPDGCSFSRRFHGQSSYRCVTSGRALSKPLTVCPEQCPKRHEPCLSYLQMGILILILLSCQEDAKGQVVSRKIVTSGSGATPASPHPLPGSSGWPLAYPWVRRASCSAWQSTGMKHWGPCVVLLRRPRAPRLCHRAVLHQAHLSGLPPDIPRALVPSSSLSALTHFLPNAYYPLTWHLVLCFLGC